MLGWIALNLRANAAVNPTAICRDPLTMDDYLTARMITTPFGLYDREEPGDGAIPVIVSGVGATRDLAKPPILGFCGVGGAKDFMDRGQNIARDGLLPLNNHGGQLSHGRTHGMTLIHEAIVQLRGEGGPWQVPGARVAVVSSGGLTPSGANLLRTDA
jgi:acetyl-CoA acetyltransferase